jgi:hypothetical protein
LSSSIGGGGGGGRDDEDGLLMELQSRSFIIIAIISLFGCMESEY